MCSYYSRGLSASHLLNLMLSVSSADKFLKQLAPNSLNPWFQINTVDQCDSCIDLGPCLEGAKELWPVWCLLSESSHHSNWNNISCITSHRIIFIVWFYTFNLISSGISVRISFIWFTYHHFLSLLVEWCCFMMHSQLCLFTYRCVCISGANYKVISSVLLVESHLDSHAIIILFSPLNISVTPFET